MKPFIANAARFALPLVASLVFLTGCARPRACADATHHAADILEQSRRAGLALRRGDTAQAYGHMQLAKRAERQFWKSAHTCSPGYFSFPEQAA